MCIAAASLERDVGAARFFDKMNTDCPKPSVALTTRFVCHAKLKLPSPLMSAPRGPKPAIAPKPKLTPEINGNRGVCSWQYGSSLTSDNDTDEDHETRKDLNGGIRAEEQFNATVLKTPQRDLQNVSRGLEDSEGTEEEKEMEEDMIQKMDEDWRLTDSALTEEPDSLETLCVSAELTADPKEAVEMTDADLTEDMDADGCDAGEALADTEGLSVGDISVNGIDEETRSSSGIRDAKERQEKEIEAGDCTADDLTESLTDEPGFLLSEHMKDADTQQGSLTDGEERQEESVSDCGITCNILKLRCGHKTKEEGENLQNISFYDFIPEGQKHFCDTAKTHAAVEEDSIREPYYVSSDDFLNREMMTRINKADGVQHSPQKPQELSSVSVGNYDRVADNGQIECLSFENYVEIINTDGFRCQNGDKNKVRGTCQKWHSFKAEEDKAHATDGFLNDLDYQPRFRLVSISVPTDTDTSLTSSLSESQLFSPSNSDIFGDDDDLDGHIVPFLDDTTDTEQDIIDAHVYEEPRHGAESENIFPLDRTAPRMQTRSMSHHVNNNVAEKGMQYVPSPYMGGYRQPALSSSPMLNSVRHNSYSKRHYLSLYPRSMSMEAQDSPLCANKEEHQRQRGAISSSGSFSRCSPPPCSGLSTPTSVVDIPPPFELAYITKRPITKSSPSLFVEGDSSEKNRKKKSSIKRFLMLKFRRKTESKSVVDVSPCSSRSSAETSHHTPSRLLDLDTHSLSRSPQLSSRSETRHQASVEPTSKFLFYNESKRKGSSVAFLNRSVIRVESFEDRSRVPFIPLPLTKPRSISFPNTDTSDYENVPISSDYENVQVPQRRPIPRGPFTHFFDHSASVRVLSSAHDTDGYVDMSGLPGFKSRTQSPEEETESAYTEAYNVCSAAVSPQAASVGDVRGETARETGGEEEQGCTSEEEDGGADSNYNRQADGRSRAFYVAKELVDTERLHVKALKLLQEDFREAVEAAVGDKGEPVVEEERLRDILSELPDVYTLHRRILSELENRIRHWEESQRIADIFLSRKAEFFVFTTYIGHYDRSMNLLEDSCRTSSCFAEIVHQFEQQSPVGEKVSLKHQLLQVIVRVVQYRMLLTDYLNNLSPDSREYEDTQAAVVMVSDIEDQVNDSLKHGKNLLRLVNIEYSVHGQRDLLQPGRVFVKEGTLMKVSRKRQQPRHLFLMNDVLLYTYPQQDGKYRLKNTLPLTRLKVSKPIIENVHNALEIKGTDITITLSASSFIEREDWFNTLCRTVTEHVIGSAAFSSSSGDGKDRVCQARDRLPLSLGEKAPTLVPVSQVMMCMNCTADFSLTLRRHHCHGCGRIVCRSCSRNRYPLKYMKDRMAKVCDHCYNELKKRGVDVSALAGKGSPRPNRSSRPISAVFQNIHPPNIWRHRKGTVSFNQVTVSEEGSVSGSLQRSKKSKRNWKRLWFLLKDKVLYTYRAEEEKVAAESLPLLGFTVKLPDRHEDDTNVFQLYHKNTLYYTFKAEDNYTARRWVNAMEEATVL